MSEKQETVADIIAEMHRFAKQHEYDHPDMDTNARGIEDFADRLKAAHERELAESGNAAKLRDALKAAELGLFRWLSGSMSRDEHRELVATIKTALAAPPRQCDMGTAEEQDARFESFCDAHRCLSCPAKTPRPFLSTCALNWAQMPYDEEGGAK